MRTPYAAGSLLHSDTLRQAWNDYNDTDSTYVSTAADVLETQARAMHEELGLPYLASLAMIYETAIQRVEFGEVDQETGTGGSE